MKSNILVDKVLNVKNYHLTMLYDTLKFIALVSFSLIFISGWGVKWKGTF